MENKDVANIYAKSGGDIPDMIFSSFLESNPIPSQGETTKSGDLLTEVLTHPKTVEPFKFENVLRRTEYLAFNKPDAEVYNPSLLYEIILEDEAHQILGKLHVIKRSASRFQPRCDIILMTSEGQTLLRLINPKRLIHKIKVLIGDKVVGSIIKSRLNICGPKYRLRDASKTEIATITSSRKYCCVTCQKLCCGADFGIFQVIRKVRHQLDKKLEKMGVDNSMAMSHHDPNDPTPISPSVASIDTDGHHLLGVICRDVTFNDRAGHEAIMEITFENNHGLDVQMKCLIIASAIFIDFSVFVPQSGQGDVKAIIATGIVLAILLGLAWVAISWI